MHQNEQATIRAFIAPARRARWLDALASPGRRRTFLDRLNHCRDIDERFATPLPSDADAVALLRARGAGVSCYVTSDLADLDGRELPLGEAIGEAEMGGFGTLICCVPGRLAYYLDEAGSRRRLLLERPGS